LWRACGLKTVQAATHSLDAGAAKTKMPQRRSPGA